MKSANSHRCGKHVVRANATSRIPVWIDCPVHRSATAEVHDRFGTIVRLEFFGEEILRLGWIVEYGMLDG
jgi:hypothetical protein